MALTVCPLSQFPNSSGSSSVVSAGSGLPSGTVTNFGSLSITSPNYFPNSTQYVAGYMDGTQHARIFIPSNASGNTYPLPTLAEITEIFQTDSAGNNKSGGFRIYLTAGSGSPDQSSPETVFLDPDGILLLASTQYG